MVNTVFFTKFIKQKIIVNIFEITTRVFFFWLKYIDYLIKNNKGAYEAASGYYFLGEKSKDILDDKELLKQFKGF